MKWQLLMLALMTAPACATTCREAIGAAESAQAIPSQLLQAIGHVESGRADPVTGEVAPWPWTVDIAGQGHFYETKDQAIAAVEEARARGIQSIDVGCLQINLLQHPDAFASLNEAFDPAANARYGAQFLKQLHDQTGSWPQAAADYHSQTPVLGEAYETLVMRAWPDERRIAGTTGPIPDEDRGTLPAFTMLGDNPSQMPYRPVPGLVRMGAAVPPMAHMISVAQALAGTRFGSGGTSLPGMPRQGRDLAAYRRMPVVITGREPLL